MSTHKIFVWRNKKSIMRISPFIWSYAAYQETPFGARKAGLDSGVVLFLGGLNTVFHCIVTFAVIVKMEQDQLSRFIG